MYKFFFLTLFSISVQAFEMYGFVPYFSYTQNIKPKYDWNLYHSDSFIFDKKEFKGREYQSGHTQLYFQSSVAYKYSKTTNFFLGYIYQRNNPFEVIAQDENRIFQQAIFAQNFGVKKLTHRFRLEERFVESSGPTEFRTRFRYQLGFNFPLQGKDLDPGEFYFNSYNEVYFSLTGSRNAFFAENWVYAGLGYQTRDFGRFEIGPVGQFTMVNQEHDWRGLYAVQLGWIISRK